MKAVVIGPVFDEVTKYSAEWCQEVAELYPDKVFLTNKAITRAEVEEALKKYPDAIVIFYDHGSEDALWGSQNEAVIDLENVDLLSNREVYTMACSSAKILGKEAYNRNCLAYWGYYEPFSFTTDAIEDFKYSANKGIDLRVKGLSWKECLEAVREVIKKFVDKLIDEGKVMAAFCMKRNGDALRCYDGEKPKPLCAFRRLAIKLFGRLGWKISRRMAISFLIFGFGLGLTIHDFFCECLTPLRFPFHGFWYGVLCVTAGFLLATYEYIFLLRKKRR